MAPAVVRLGERVRVVMKQPKLLETYEQLLGGWRDTFTQVRVWERVRRLTLGMLVSLRLHLTSTAICATGRQFQDWTADYRVCSQSPWNPRELFDPILDALAELLSGPEAPVLAALDDTMVKKTGRKIPGVAIGRDPMSPPFHVNLCYGLRFVQASVLVAPPQGEGAARALPVRFEFAPPAVKPKSKSRKSAGDPTAGGETAAGAENAAEDPTVEPPANANKAKGKNKGKKKKAKPPETPEEAAYKQEKKLRRLPQVGLNTIHSLRESLEARPELRQRRLIVSGDATYTTRLVLRGLPDRTVYIGRIRRDAKLHWPLDSSTATGKGRPRQYGPPAPTPGQILQDESIPWVKVRCFAAGQFREIPVKVVGPLYWRNAGVDLPVQVVVIKPLGYRLRHGGKLLYRQPAFLICTDPELPLETLVQAYVYRWEIECNHRDEKSLLGVAKGQVRNPEAVRRLPQLQVAGYSLLLLASLQSSGFTRKGGEYLPLPKWRKLSDIARPSLLDMLNLLRQQIFACGLDMPLPGFEAFTNTVPEVVKPSKPPLAAETLGTLAA
jgi:hypothetical protein